MINHAYTSMENDSVAQSEAKNVSSVGCNTQVYVIQFTQIWLTFATLERLNSETQGYDWRSSAREVDGYGRDKIYCRIASLPLRLSLYKAIYTVFTTHNYQQ